MRLIDADAANIYLNSTGVEMIKNMPGIELPDGYDLDRLKELAEADKDNRCLILPVKVGDILYYPYNNYISQLQVKYITICSKETFIIYTEIIEGLNDIETNFNSKWIGETIFLTKEEAEKALGGGWNEIYNCTCFR